MAFHSSNEDAGHESFLMARDSADHPAWRQDDAPTVSEAPPDDASAEVVETPPSRTPEELIAVLEATPAEFARLIEGERRERLAKPASDGGWGVVEILPHLALWEEVAAFWARRTLNEDEPVLDAVDDSLWAIEHDYASEDPFEALERFATLRYTLVQALQALDDDDWRRTAIHAMHGRMTLHQLMDWMCDHDARYLAQAREALT